MIRQYIQAAMEKAKYKSLTTRNRIMVQCQVSKAFGRLAKRWKNAAAISKM